MDFELMAFAHSPCYPPQRAHLRCRLQFIRGNRGGRNFIRAFGYTKCHPVACALVPTLRLADCGALAGTVCQTFHLPLCGTLANTNGKPFVRAFSPALRLAVRGADAGSESAPDHVADGA